MVKRKKSTDSYSLALFGNQETDIFKKPVQASQMIIQTGSMSGQQLLAWNILLKNAKEQKDLWKDNKAFVKETTYRISRRELMEKMGYLSTNRKPFKEALLKMQEIKALWDVLGHDGGNSWASCVLLPFVQCDEEYVRYAFVNQIEPMLFESTIYSKLDLIIQRNLKLDASRKLYDWINRYRTNPSSLSNLAPWEFWSKIIHGDSEETAYTKQYKIFKRDKLNPALREINEISDLYIELIEDKNGTRSVVNLQFKVIEKPKFATESEEKEFKQNNLGTVTIEFSKLNITNYFKKKIKEQFPVDVINANINYVEKLVQKNPEQIKSHGAYLLSACEGNYANHSEAKSVVNVSQPNIIDQTAQVLERLNHERNTNAQNMFSEMDANKQKDLIKQYNSVVDDSFKIPDENSKKSNRLLIPFFAWLAKTTWGEPTPEEIIQYTLKHNN